jgi:NADPH2:quinone reductase
MKAASYQEVEPAKRVLRLGEHSIPEVPSGGVLVKVWASGVNPSDVKRRAGWLNALMEYPEVIPHSDGAGVIIAVGEKVSKKRLDERIWV